MIRCVHRAQEMSSSSRHDVERDNTATRYDVRGKRWKKQRQQSRARAGNSIGAAPHVNNRGATSARYLDLARPRQADIRLRFILHPPDPTQPRPRPLPANAFTHLTPPSQRGFQLCRTPRPKCADACESFRKLKQVKLWEMVFRKKVKLVGKSQQKRHGRHVSERGRKRTKRGVPCQRRRRRGVPARPVLE